MLSFPVSPGGVFWSGNEANNWIRDTHQQYPLVMKVPYGSSGKGVHVVRNHKELNAIIKILSLHSNIFPIIVEKWFENCISINYQFYIDERGKTYYSLPKNQIMRGSVFRGCDGVTRNHRLNEEQQKYIKFVQEKMARELFRQGHYGMFSVDGLVLEDGNIIPILEINGRFSMTTYISQICQKLGHEKDVHFEYINIKPISEYAFIDRAKEYFFTKERGEGVILCSFNPGKVGINPGRVFLIYISNSMQELSLLRDSFRMVFCDIVLV